MPVNGYRSSRGSAAAGYGHHFGVLVIELDLSTYAGLTPVEMLGYSEFPAIQQAPYFLTLGPYGFQWYELKRPER